MGNEIVKEKLYRSIAKKNTSTTDRLLSTYPQLVNSILTTDSKMTPLLKAIVHNNIPTIELIIGYGGNPQLPNSKGISPLMLCSIRNNMELVKYFVQKHKVDLTRECNEGFNALDYAILGGHYNIAQYLYNLNRSTLKEAVTYETYRKKQKGRYVNYQVLLIHLEKNLPFQSLPEYLETVKPVFKDPVIDPRENWKSMIVRIANFENPPIVERNDLPQELRPQNRNVLSRIRTRIENGKSETSSQRHVSPVREQDNALIAHLKRTKQLSVIQLKGL